jgi:hypothetical protein
MPIRLTRSEYEEKRRSPLQADRDTLDEMLTAGATVENLPQSEKPSLLGFGKEMVKKLLGGGEAKAEDGESIGSRVGSGWAENIRRRRALTNPDEEAGMREWADINRGVGQNEINETTQRIEPSETVKKRLKKKEGEEG